MAALIFIVVVALVAIAIFRRHGSTRPPSVAALHLLGPGTHTFNLDVNGLTRSYRVDVPPEVNGGKVPGLIFGFHGARSDPQGFANVTRLSAVAGPRGFVTVYPAGYGMTWNAGDCCDPAKAKGIDDVAFVKAILQDLRGRLTYDDARIYATGWSNGGKFTLRLACELADRLAAVVAVDANLGVTDCRLARPIPVLLFHGTADTFSPYNGGVPTVADAPRTPQTSTPDTFQKFAQLDGCQGEPEVTLKRGAATFLTYTHCKQGTTVALCTIDGMGHQWPGHTITPEEVRQRGLPEWLTNLGAGSNDVDATSAAVAFFEKHPLPGAATQSKSSLPSSSPSS